MADPNLNEKRAAWAKEAINALPPLAATEPVPPVVDDTPVEAKHLGTAKDAQRRPPAKRK